MIEMNTNFETEEGIHIDLKAQDRAVDVRLYFIDVSPDTTNTLPLDETIWLNAREAEALGHALLAMAQASRTLGVQHA